MRVPRPYYANVRMIVFCDYTHAAQNPMLKFIRIPATCDKGFGCDASKNAYKH
jgi:hypothetical protein